MSNMENEEMYDADLISLQDEDGNDVYTAPDEALEDKLFETFIANRGDESES